MECSASGQRTVLVSAKTHRLAVNEVLAFHQVECSPSSVNQDSPCLYQHSPLVVLDFYLAMSEIYDMLGMIT